MSERLTDADLETLGLIWQGDVADAIYELLALRRLVNGGPCATCGGTGVAHYQTHLEPAEPCRGCDGDGRTPGIIERLCDIDGALADWRGQMDLRDISDDVRVILADLRKAVES